MRSSLHLCRPPWRIGTPPPHPPRCFSTTTPSLALGSRHAAGQIEIKTIQDKIALLNLDERISSRYVQTKTPEGKLSDPQDLRYLLKSIDRKTQHVMQINSPDDPMAIVQIVGRADVIKQINRKEDLARHQKRTEREKRPKQIELNWAISDNDLQLKMKQMQDFLNKGKKVEVLMANKRYQRKASPEEASALLNSVRTSIDEANATESKPMEGAILKQAMLTVKLRGT